MAELEEGVTISASSECPQLRKVDRFCQPSCCCCICCGKRWSMALLMMFGFIITFGMRCNIGVAIVKIMSTTSNEIEVEEFNWTPETIGYVDVSFFWGFVLTQLPGGILSAFFPAHYVFGAGIFLSSCLNLLIPAATFDPKAVIAVRFIQGLTDGITIPASYGIWRWWAPAPERTCLATIAFSGSYFGIVIGMPLADFLSDGVGWKIPFYFYGCAGIVWFFFWLWLAFEKPSKHPAISTNEKQQIEESTGGSKSVGPTIKTTPWLKMLSSLPLWAIVLASCSNHITNYLILVTSHQYFRGSFGFERFSFFVSLLPQLIVALVMPITGVLADFIRKKKIMSDTNIRKFFNTAGMGGQVLFLLVIGFATDKMVALFALFAIATANGVAQSGFHFNHLDIAPRYASILVGITNTVGVFAGLQSPILISYLLRTFSIWQYLFIAVSIINSFGVVFYAIFASGEVREWAVTPRIDTVEMKGENNDVNN